MNSQKTIYLFLLCLFCLFSKVSTGALCFPACLVFCAANPVMFAGALASGGVTEIACFPGCSIACSMGLFVPAACFSEDTILTVKDSNKVFETEIKNIKRNDYVLTLDNNGNQMYTKVVSNIKSKGNYDFLDIICQASSGNKELKVTKDHSLVVGDENKKEIILAKNVKVGMNFFINNGLCEVKQINQIILNEKYTLITEDGTIISSGIFSSTICDSEIDEHISFEKNLEKWKNNHNFISSKYERPEKVKK